MVAHGLGGSNERRLTCFEVGDVVESHESMYSCTAHLPPTGGISKLVAPIVPRRVVSVHRRRQTQRRNTHLYPRFNIGCETSGAAYRACCAKASRNRREASHIRPSLLVSENFRVRAVTLWTQMIYSMHHVRSRNGC